MGEDVQTTEAKPEGLNIAEELKGILFKRVDLPGIGDDVLMITEGELRKLAQKTDNKLDDAIVDLVMPLVRQELHRRLDPIWKGLSES